MTPGAPPPRSTSLGATGDAGRGRRSQPCLFDLRSRGRRRTVQAVYLSLAILMGGGLVLFGVGTGSGIGGLLNAFTGSGSGNQQNQVISQQEKAAVRQTKLTPNSAAAWAALVSARYDNASSSGFNPTTSTYTAAGKKELAARRPTPGSATCS